jgi:uncharacterized protein YndB with AHSA1/START domain
MASMAPASDTTLQIRRVFAAPPEKAYAAWTQPERMKNWFLKPAETHVVQVEEIDLREGGRLRARTQKMPDGEVHTLQAVFREVRPSEKLVFTWRWENKPAAGETLVTVEFRQLGESKFSEIILTHEMFPDKRTRDEHGHGWRACLAALGHTLGDDDFRMVLRFDVPLDVLYRQFATEQGVRNWWTAFCNMEEKVGGQATFRFPSSKFHAGMIITRLEPGRVVEWRCIECQHPPESGYMDLSDWAGTNMRFEIAGDGEGKSQLTFTHAGLIPLECERACRSAWSFYLNESLRKYLETGRGSPHTKGA